ncbi:MAG: hypothetical protein J3K34DRAFT_433264 [Monoraphidium minutum]|nr:MAG: hypothetical protein J3K34DRAFT_433264 [Monoraphidium minutum]
MSFVCGWQVLAVLPSLLQTPPLPLPQHGASLSPLSARACACVRESSLPLIAPLQGRARPLCRSVSSLEPTQSWAPPKKPQPLLARMSTHQMSFPT